MNNFIKSIFGQLNNAFLIRHYIYGAIMFSLLLMASPALPFIIFMVISLLLYPFAMFVYDSIVGTLMGNNTVITSVFVSVIWGVIKTGIIFTFSIFISPIGIGYLYLRNNSMASDTNE